MNPHANDLLIGSDLHNTLVYADDAWETAFSELSGLERFSVRELLRSKKSRHLIAEQLRLDYAEVYRRYHQHLRVNHGMEQILISLQKHYPIVLISSADEKRVHNDMKKLNLQLQFQRVCTKQNFQKANPECWKELRNTFDCRTILYFGNDLTEDCPPIHFVKSVLVSGRFLEATTND